MKSHCKVSNTYNHSLSCILPRHHQGDHTHKEYLWRHREDYPMRNENLLVHDLEDFSTLTSRRQKVKNSAPLIHAMNFNIRDDLRSKSTIEIRETLKRQSIPVTVFLYEPSSGMNIGSVIRSANAFGVIKVYIIGNQKFDARACVGTHNYIDVENISYEEALTLMKFKRRIMIEFPGSPYNVYMQRMRNMGDTQVPYVFIYGSESDGIPQRYKQQIEDIKDAYETSTVSIPMQGSVRSLNLSNAVAITLSYANLMFNSK